MKIVLLVGLFVCSNVLAKDLGVIGPSYPIAEENIMMVLKNRLLQKEQSGELALLHNEWLNRSKNYVKRPTGIFLPRAKQYRVFSVDPVYTLDRDLFDAKGVLLFKKGARVNPLVIQPVKGMLCFIDGDDVDQVVWLKNYCAKEPLSRMILVKGDYLRLSQNMNKRLYFDQQGKLIARLDIQALPAVVRARNQVLYVEEFPLE
jgi:conjugal transfer pilus assembly protein TraW